MINTENIEYGESRWGDIYKHLKSKGYKVYPPNIAIGECTEPYIIVKDNGANPHPSFSTIVQSYSIMCYVPGKSYSTLMPFVAAVAGVLSDLRPMIKTDGTKTPSFYDDTIKAHMISLECYNYIKK